MFQIWVFVGQLFEIGLRAIRLRRLVNESNETWTKRCAPSWQLSLCSLASSTPLFARLPSLQLSYSLALQVRREDLTFKLGCSFLELLTNRFKNRVYKQSVFNVLAKHPVCKPYRWIT